MSTKKPTWHIRLGNLEAQRHTYIRAVGDKLRLLGSIRRGAQVGALAINADGRYLAVVGDYETPLNSSQVTRAMASAVHEPVSRHVPSGAQISAPTVVIKRRRTFVAPSAAALQ